MTGLLWTITLLTLADLDWPVHPDVVARFTVQHCPGPQGPIVYRLYRPPSAGTRKLPLVVWLHGRGEAGDDNRRQLTWLELVFGADRYRRTVGVFVLAVQCPAACASWRAQHLEDGDPLLRVDAAIDDVLRRHPVDPDRIHLAGISQGASACWQYAGRYPNRFAGMLVMATCEIDSSGVADRLADLPIWVFQSVADGPAQLKQMTNQVRALNHSGRHAQLTVVDSPDHDCWTHALRDAGGWGWLVQQRRGRRLTRFPDEPRPWHVVALLAAGMVVVVVAWWLRNDRRL